MDKLFKPNSIGRNIERIRKIKGIKQETLAKELGVSRQAVSKIEQSDDIDDDKLESIASILGVPSEAIKHFNDESVFINIQSMHDNSGIYNYHFNPIEKIVELYERMLELEREKIELLKNTQSGK